MSSGRPETLFPLFGDLTGLPGIGPKTAKHFERLGITRVIDLALTLPTGVEDRRLRESASKVKTAENVSSRRKRNRKR